MTIWKFPLPSHGGASVKMPKGARILSVQNQGEHPTLWAMVNPSEQVEKEHRHFFVAMTGHPLGRHVDAHDTFLGTVQLAEGAFVAHVFEVKS
jgi:hypothetical protein